MADIIWGNVYLHDVFAGILNEGPDGRYIFTYDESYLNSANPAISHSLKLRKEPYISEYRALHPFFDNLVSEGWLGDVQVNRIHNKHRFARLLHFGYDLIGAVSILDPEPDKTKTRYAQTDKAIIAAGISRASAGGFQKKLLVVKEDGKYRPAYKNELSTYIAKFDKDNNSSPYSQIEVEYLTMLAISKLLPNDAVAEIEIANIEDLDQKALIVKRFDREAGKRIHFEEFNQLLGRYSYDSSDKYNGAYEDMAIFINNTPNCLKSETFILLKRILASLLVSNTDGHFKNFAMFHGQGGLRLTPLYDVAALPLWDTNLNTIALSVGGIKDLSISDLKPKHLLLLGKGFGFTEDMTNQAIDDLYKFLPNALAAIEQADKGSKTLRQNLIKKIEARWKGSFALTGQILSARQNKEEKNKNSLNKF